MLSDGVRANRRLEKAYKMLKQVPFFAGVRRGAVEIEPLGSLTNMTYKVTVAGTAYALRLPGQDTWKYIDRAAEEHNSRIAATAGIGTDILYSDARNGTAVTRFIEGDAIDAAWLNRDAEALVRVTQTLKRVHGLGQGFRFRFDVFGMIERCRHLLLQIWMQPMPPGYGEVGTRDLKAARRALEASPIPDRAVPQRPVAEQLYRCRRSSIHLIDWEFSGMNDPFWDLSHLSTEAGFGPVQDRTMMEAYCHGDVPEELYSRLEIYKALDDLLWSLWGFIQYANQNPLDDFFTYAQERFVRCAERMEDPSFGHHLDVVRVDTQGYVA